MNDGAPHGQGGVTSPLHLKEEEERSPCLCEHIERMVKLAFMMHMCFARRARTGELPPPLTLTKKREREREREKGGLPSGPQPRRKKERERKKKRERKTESSRFGSSTASFASGVCYTSLHRRGEAQS